MWFLLFEWNRARLYDWPTCAGWVKCVEEASATAHQHMQWRSSKQCCPPDHRRTIGWCWWSVHLLSASVNLSSSTTGRAALRATQEEEGRRLKLSFLWRSYFWDYTRSFIRKIPGANARCRKFLFFFFFFVAAKKTAHANRGMERIKAVDKARSPCVIRCGAPGLNLGSTGQEHWLF